MENLIRLAFRYYNSFRAQAALDGKWTDVLKKEDQLQRIHKAALRVEMIQNWLNMLSDDERYVVEQHLVHNIEWARVCHAFGKHWDSLFFRSERQLGTYQAEALRKIVSFCQTYEDIFHWLFDDLGDTEHLLTQDIDRKQDVLLTEKKVTSIKRNHS